MNLLESMEIFVHVVEHTSFTRAADAMQMHRPVVSKAILGLEEQLGVRLLHRTTRKISLTTEGEEFYQRSKQILADVADAVGMFSGEQVPQGRLRIDLPPAVAKTIIIPALPAFKQSYPGIELVVRSSDRRVDLVAEGIDCAVRLGDLEDSSLVARKLGDIEMITCASPAYLQGRGTPKSLGDLEGHLAINFLVENGRTLLEWRFHRDDGVETCRLPSALVVDDSEALLSCGLAGFGMMQTPRAFVQPYLDSGALVEVLQENPAVPKPVSLILTNRRYVSPKLRVFADWLSEVFRAHARSRATAPGAG